MTDPNPAQSFSERILHWWPILLLFLGVAGTQVWNAYKNRTRKFAWQAWHSPIAMAGTTPFLGNVTVQHNGIPVTHLHTTIVEFENASTKDVTDLLITLSFLNGGNVLNAAGTVDSTQVSLDPAYLAQLQANQNNITQLQQLTKAVVFRVPVLNRWKKATFNLLVHRDDLSNPYVLPSCAYPGFTVEQKILFSQLLYGVSRNAAALIGILFTAPTVVLLVLRYPHHPVINAAIAYVLGLGVAGVGVLVVRLSRFFGKTFG
jgi:hypothetical protein